MGALEKIYSDLDFQSGELLSVEDTPNFHHKNVWLEKGEWLVTAKRANAEKIFFVENNPVAVFAECGANHTEKHKAFNRIWSLARPRLLFLASPGEITVYDLAQKPFDFSEISKRKNKLIELAILHDIKRVAQELQDFHRDNIESGKIFEKGLFGDLKNRADKALIRDLKTVRCELIRAGLSGEKVKYAHALIARSIFSLGILTCLAFSIAKAKSGFFSGSLPFSRAATVIILEILEKAWPFLASWRSFRYLILAHLE